MKTSTSPSESGALDAVRAMEFPGRIILVGKTPAGVPLALYGITRRRPEERERRFEVADGTVKVVSTTDGSPLYTALISSDGIAVGNGEQTEKIARWLEKESEPVAVLKGALRNVFYQYQDRPDKRKWIPRISGCLKNDLAALSIAYVEENGHPAQVYYSVTSAAGEGIFIATYAVSEKHMTAPFKKVVSLPWEGLEDTVDALYDALGPRSGAEDCRVGVVGVLVRANGPEIQVRNSQ